jgi:hypothetical protein
MFISKKELNDVCVRLNSLSYEHHLYWFLFVYFYLKKIYVYLKFHGVIHFT